uniref:Uncharacterized protein n=1 Tax=Haplochromis burtoni TaxID=8153 RepID=A0A3Q2WWY0_HAPBU
MRAASPRPQVTDVKCFREAVENVMLPVTSLSTSGLMVSISMEGRLQARPRTGHCTRPRCCTGSWLPACDQQCCRHRCCSTLMEFDVRKQSLSRIHGSFNSSQQT